MSTSSEYLGQYMVLVGRTMKRLFPKIQQQYPWIAGHYHIGSFTGSPDDMWLYFYPDTQQRRTECLTPETEAAIRASTCEELAADGYPSSALPSLKITYPTKEEIDAAGGEFAFFR
jgi:hypothetical protein